MILTDLLQLDEIQKLLQLVDKLQHAGKIDNSQQVCGSFGRVIEHQKVFASSLIVIPINIFFHRKKEEKKPDKTAKTEHGDTERKHSTEESAKAKESKHESKKESKKEGKKEDRKDKKSSSKSEENPADSSKSKS